MVGTCGITASERGASLRAYGFYPLVVMARTMLFGVRRKERVSFFGSAGGKWFLGSNSYKDHNNLSEGILKLD